MSDYKIVDAEKLDTDLSSVADAIRTKGGTSESLTFPQGFVDAVGAIESGGGGTEEIENIIDNSGVLDNTDGTATEKVEQLIEYANFKNIIQESLNYDGNLSATDNITAFRCTSLKDVSMFDFSKVTNMEYAFYNTLIIDLEIDLTNTTSVYYMCGENKNLRNVIIKNMNNKCTTLGYAFYACSNLERIETLDISGCIASSGYSSPFRNCGSLKTILFVKNCIKRSIYFGDSPLLSAESIQSIIDGLNSEVTGQTLTISRAAVKKAFETSEGANDGDTSETWNALVASKPNWTITLS